MSLSASTSPPVHLYTTGEKTHHVEPRSEKPTVESEQPSTVASSIINEPGDRENDFPATGKKSAEKLQDPVAYPKGAEMLFVMLALVLSITLCSLDQVSSSL
jgi:hypothetical protein